MGSPRGKKGWYEENPRETEGREPRAAGEHTTATKHTNRRPEGTKRARVVCPRAQANTNKVWQRSTNPNPPQQSPQGSKDQGRTTSTKYTTPGEEMP